MLNKTIDTINIPDKIINKLERALHNKHNHPIEILKRKIYDIFGPSFKKYDNLNSIVSTIDNFDKLLWEIWKKNTIILEIKSLMI